MNESPTERARRRCRLRGRPKAVHAALGAALAVLSGIAIRAGSAHGDDRSIVPDGDISWCATLGQRPPMQVSFSTYHTQGVHKYGWRLLIDDKDVVSGMVELGPFEWYTVPHQYYPVSIGSNYVLRIQDKDTSGSAVWVFQTANLYDCSVPPTTVEADPGR